MDPSHRDPCFRFAAVCLAGATAPTTRVFFFLFSWSLAFDITLDETALASCTFDTERISGSGCPANTAGHARLTEGSIELDFASIRPASIRKGLKYEMD
jgi:hypothetical protein